MKDLLLHAHVIFKTTNVITGNFRLLCIGSDLSHSQKPTRFWGKVLKATILTFVYVTLLKNLFLVV